MDNIEAATLSSISFRCYLPEFAYKLSIYFCFFSIFSASVSSKRNLYQITEAILARWSGWRPVKGGNCKRVKTDKVWNSSAYMHSLSSNIKLLRLVFAYSFFFFFFFLTNYTYISNKWKCRVFVYLFWDCLNLDDKKNSIFMT